MVWAPKVPTSQPADNSSQQADKEPATKKKAIAAGSRRVVSLGTMFSQNQPVNANKKAPSRHDPMAELVDYLSLSQEDLNCNILEWWASREECFPNLSRMARQYLGIPSSSAAVERLFSAAGRDFSHLRHNMKASTLENLMWARAYLKHHPVE